MQTEMHRVARFCFKISTRTQHRVLFTVRHRRQRLSIQARPLSWEIPKHLFPRPETFFPRPQRIFDGDTFRDLVLKQGEVIRDFPWEYIILLTIVAFIFAEIFVKPSDSNEEEEGPSDTSTDRETRNSLSEEKKTERRVVPETDEERMIYAMKKIIFQEEQNRSLAILGAVAVLALWMAGFLNTPHPFYP